MEVNSVILEASRALVSQTRWQLEAVLKGCLFTAKIRLGGAGESSAVNEDVEQEAWIDLMKLGSVFSHEGSNLYLRLWQLGQSADSDMITVSDTHSYEVITAYQYEHLTALPDLCSTHSQQQSVFISGQPCLTCTSHHESHSSLFYTGVTGFLESTASF